MPSYTNVAASGPLVVPLNEGDFGRFLNHLQMVVQATEETLAEYRQVWKEWRDKADATGVVSIPKADLTQELLRILTGASCGDAENVAEEIADGNPGLFLDGRVFVHPRAGQPTLPAWKEWFVYHYTPPVKGEGAKPAAYRPVRRVVSEPLVTPSSQWDELNWQSQLVPKGARVLVIEGTAIGPNLVQRETNTLRKLGELRGFGTGFLVTTMVTKDKVTKKPVQWIKVGVFLPLSLAALAHVPQLAADLREALCWLHLDKRINVSVRIGDGNGLITKDHTGGYEAVRKIAPAMAPNFFQNGKGAAWRIPCEDLPTDSFSQVREFEEVVAAYAAAADEPEPEAEPMIVIPPLPSAAQLLGGNWADDSDDEELEPFQPPSVPEPAKTQVGPEAKAEPPVAKAPSVAEPAKTQVGPGTKAPSVPEPVPKAKTKTRRGGAAARKRRQRAQE